MVLCGFFLGYKIVHIPLQLEFVILFTAIIFYPVIRQPSIGIYLVFTIMPLIPFFRRLYYLLEQRPSIDPLIALGDIVTAITLIGLFFVIREQRIPSGNRSIVTRIILFYFCYLFFRVFFLNALAPMDALMRFRFYGPAVLLFFLGRFFATNTTLLIRIWLITIILGIVAALYGFKQLFIGYSEAEKLWFSSISFTTLFIKGLARPFSFFQAPASFADYMQLAIIGCLAMYSMRSSVRKIFFLIPIPVFFYAALITSVRSNWIGIILSFIVWISLIQIRKNHHRLIAIVSLFIVFIGIQSIEPAAGTHPATSMFIGTSNQQYMDLLITERTSAISNPFEEYSFISRVNLWKCIFDLSIDPVMALLGRGVGVLNADSLYFTYLAEFGYPGMAFIIWFVVFIILRGFSLIDTATSEQTRSLSKCITLMNIVFAVINITGTHIHSFPGDAFFWFWNGVLLRLAEPSGMPQNRSVTEPIHHLSS